MPYLDGTGPRGMGPRTGRGFGNCSGFAGRFCRFCPFASGRNTITKEEQRETLLKEKEMIEKELSDLEEDK